MGKQRGRPELPVSEKKVMFTLGIPFNDLAFLSSLCQERHFDHKEWIKRIISDEKKINFLFGISLLDSIQKIQELQIKLVEVRKQYDQLLEKKLQQTITSTEEQPHE